MNVRNSILTAFHALNDVIEGFLLWRDAETLDGAGRLVSRWLRGDLRYLPWDGNTPYTETKEAEGFAEAMARVNDLGIVTIGSQPGIVSQREFVELVLDEARLSLVRATARKTGVVVEMVPDGRRPFRDATPVTLRKGKPYTRLGGNRKGFANMLGYGSRSLSKSITGGRYVLLALYDEEFERRGRVQETLECVADHLGAETGAGSGL